MSPEEKAELLDTIRRAHIQVEAVNLQLKEAAAAARRAGVTWTEIGSVFGITRQAAWERFNKE